MNKRYIVDKSVDKSVDIIEPGEFYIHPITLEIRTNVINTSIVPTAPFYNIKTNTIEYDKPYTFKKDDMNIDMKKFMTLPYLNLDRLYILKIYNIVDIDELLLFIKKNIDNTTFSFLNRLLNIWVKENYSMVVKNPNLIIDVYKIITKKYLAKYIDKTIDNNKIDDIIKKFIEKWLTQHNNEDFHFDIGNDLKNYLVNLI